MKLSTEDILERRIPRKRDDKPMPKIRFRRPKVKHEAIKSPVLMASEAADYLNVGRSTLQKMVKEGWIVPSRTPGGHFRFTISQLNKALRNSREQKGARTWQKQKNPRSSKVK